MKIRLTQKRFGHKDNFSLQIYYPDGSFTCYFFTDLNSIVYLSRIRKLGIDLSDIFSNFSLHSTIDVSSCLSDIEDIIKTFNIKVIK